MQSETRPGILQPAIQGIGGMLLRYEQAVALKDAQGEPYIEIFRARAFQLAIDQKRPDVALRLVRAGAGTAEGEIGGAEGAEILRASEGKLRLREELDGVSYEIPGAADALQALLAQPPRAITFSFIVPAGGDRWSGEPAQGPRRREIRRALLTEITFRIGPLT